MKNSPHKIKHRVKKALRQASHIVLNQAKDPSRDVEKRTSEYNRHRREGDSLKSINIQVVKEVLNLYKHHLERARLMDKAHSKRSSPGLIEGDRPHTQPNYQSPKVFALRTHQGSLKTDKIARTMLKNNHSYREAA